jgi:hypothetical protein
MKDKNLSGKSTAAIVIAFICICLYLGALISTAVRIYLHIDMQRDIALDEFTYIADLASSAGVLGFMDEPFIETIQESLSASKTLEGLIITGSNGGYGFEKIPGRAITTVNNSPRFINRFDFSRQLLFMPLRIQNLRNINIEARSAAVDYERVTDILKQSLLVVLAALLVAFFTLLMQSLLDSGRERRTGASAHDGSYGGASQVTQDSFDIPDEPPVLQKPPVELKRKVPAAKKREQPKGLYSPRGNIGWEEYTSIRLESELIRCAANEQDLVYMVMEFKDLNIMDENFYLNFADDAVVFFTMRDLIFERGDRGIAVILPNSELDTAIAKAGEFHDRCLGKYAGIFKTKTDLCIGLSSRSGRLIDAERLRVEAGEALEKALIDPVSHIIAFKSDPEKYRAYIASRTHSS